MTQIFPRKDFFNLPSGMIYLDGNSLGAAPAGMDKAVAQTINDEWSAQLIQAWNKAGWMDMPRQVGDLIAPIVGAPAGSIAMGDTLSIKVYQAVAAALARVPDRKIILSDTGNFPSDLYMAQGLVNLLERGYELKTVAPETVTESINDEVAAVLLTQVDYRTGRMHDMQNMTTAAHNAGAVMIWDLAHSAGAVPIDLTASNAEFAVGCTYKYLNGGPGAPAFIYVRPDIVDRIQPVLAGWLGHESPFAMEPEYRPAMTTERMRVGTPSIIQFSMLKHALSIWEDIDMQELRRASVDLCELFITEVEARCPALTLASPRNHQERGSQVSFSFSEGYAAMQALIEHGVIGDFRAPDIMRFGFTPLYIDADDVVAAATTLEQIMTDELWRDPKYHVMSRVT